MLFQWCMYYLSFTPLWVSVLFIRRTGADQALRDHAGDGRHLRREIFRGGLQGLLHGAGRPGEDGQHPGRGGEEISGVLPGDEGKVQLPPLRERGRDRELISYCETERRL